MRIQNFSWNGGMVRNAVVLGGALVFFLGFAVSSAQAQTSPTLSPWLLMDRSRRTPATDYLNYVKPRQELTQQLQRQEYQLQRTQSETREIQHQLSDDGKGKNLKAPGAAGPSTGARGAAAFRNYGHWYTGLPGTPVPQRPR